MICKKKGIKKLFSEVFTWNITLQTDYNWGLPNLLYSNFLFLINLCVFETLENLRLVPPGKVRPPPLWLKYGITHCVIYSDCNSGCTFSPKIIICSIS